MDFCRLRHVISGGEKLSPEVARVWMEKFGVRIMEGYGATECAPVISLATPAAYRRGAVGRFLPGVDYRIEPMDGIDKGGRAAYARAEPDAGLLPLRRIPA